MEWPLMATALAFLAAYAWPILHLDLPAALVQTCSVVVWVSWLVFAADYGIRVALAQHRRRYVLRHLHDLAVIALPLLRPLRLLRLITVISVLNRRAGSSLRGRVAVYVAGGTALLVGVAALAMLDAERDSPDANVTGIGDALWWAITTVTTVGYGDRYPTTTEGRFIAVGLMVAGIALLGVVTASLASWLVDRVREESGRDRAATVAHVEALAAEVRALRQQLRDTAAVSPAPSE
jgi:voltage-gated potassium channel